MNSLTHSWCSINVGYCSGLHHSHLRICPGSHTECFVGQSIRHISLGAFTVGLVSVLRALGL